MTGREFRENLHSDSLMLGTLIVSPSPFWPKLVAGAGLDFVFIDTEHIAIDREHLSWMCRTYGAMGLPPLVRINEPNPYLATMAYDDGAKAVVAPYIEEVEQVTRLCGAGKCRPLKGGRLADVLEGEPLDSTLDAYIKKNTDENTVVINIESQPAIDRLDDLLEVDGLDAVLIGPHDLSCNLSVPEDYEHPVFLKAVETIFKAARHRGLGAGIHYWGSHEEQKRMVDLGANFLIHKADAIFFREGLTSEISELRKILGQAETGKEDREINI